MTYRLAGMFTHAHNVTTVMVFLSSTLNPFIYGLWGKHFREGIMRGIKTALCCIGYAPKNTMTAGYGNEGINITNKDRPFPNITEDTAM